MTMKITAALLLASSASVAAFSTGPSSEARANVALQETKADLEALATELNPVISYYDPLNLASLDMWQKGEEATVGFLRHAEIKHGRIAMFAFVGYCVQSNWHWPWAMTLAGDPFPSTDLSPPEQWAALPVSSKHQIIAVIGFLEAYSEMATSLTGPEGIDHYMKGGKPGRYPDFGAAVPHPVPFNLYDPFKLSAKRSDEQKAKGLKAEINNGRLAMLGIFGFLVEQTIPGSVPGLTGVVKPYAGDLIAGDRFSFF